MVDAQNIPVASPPAGGSTTVYGSATLNNGTQNVNAANTGVGSARSYFSPEQLAAQSQYFNTLGGYLNGTSQVPAYMTAPPQVFQAYNDAFNKYVKPGIASQYGAGSPQIGAQQSFGNEQLAAQLYQSGLSNYLQGLGLQGNAAFNPQGQNTTNNTLGQTQTQNQQTGYEAGLSTTTLGQSLLSLLLSRLGA